MKDLKELRLDINEIDQQIASLYEKRMQIVKEVASYKLAHNLDVFDASREQEVLKRNVSLIQDEDLRPLYGNLVEELLKESKAYQRYFINEIYDDVIVGKDILKDVSKYVNLNRKVMIISDSDIPDVYLNKVAAQCQNVVIQRFPNGEANKNVENYQELLGALVDHQFTRNDLIIAIGGGVTTDLAGFVASSYMRGIEFVNIPTTLLSQVDASIGGKTGIDFKGYKNIVGAFYKPSKVIVDVKTLDTLDERLYIEGISEIIKMALTLDKDFFMYLESLSLDSFKENILNIVKKSIALKSKIVALDEKESDLRRVLNFGHTIGHAVEALAKGDILHGEAVSIGMTFMVEEPLKTRLIELLKRYHLPVDNKFSAEEIISYIKMDKKKVDDDFVIIVKANDIGSFLFKQVNIKELKTLLDRRIKDE